MEKRSAINFIYQFVTGLPFHVIIQSLDMHIKSDTIQRAHGIFKPRMLCDTKNDLLVNNLEWKNLSTGKKKSSKIRKKIYVRTDSQKSKSILTSRLYYPFMFYRNENTQKFRERKSL